MSYGPNWKVTRYRTGVSYADLERDEIDYIIAKRRLGHLGAGEFEFTTSATPAKDLLENDVVVIQMGWYGQTLTKVTSGEIEKRIEEGRMPDLDLRFKGKDWGKLLVEKRFTKDFYDYTAAEEIIEEIVSIINKYQGSTVDVAIGKPSTIIPVASTTAFTTNDTVRIGTDGGGGGYDVGTIQSISAGVSITISPATSYGHSVGDKVRIIDLPTELERKILFDPYKWDTGVNIKTSFSQSLLKDAVSEVADKVTRDFYVDPDKELQFPEAEGTDSGVELDEDDLLSYDYYQDQSHILNRVRVIGAKTNILPWNTTYPEDGYTEKLNGSTDWTDQTGVTSWDNSAGNFKKNAWSLKCYNSTGYIVEAYRTFTQFDATQIWSFKKLKFWFKFIRPGSVWPDARFYLLAPDWNNRFTFQLYGLDQDDTWMEFDLPIGEDYHNVSYWDPTYDVGNPDWTKITGIGFGCEFDSGDTGAQWNVDHLRFYDGRFVGLSEDDSIVNEEDVKYKEIWNDTIKSLEDAQRLAEKIHGMYSSPLDIVENVVTEDGIETLNPGETLDFILEDE